MKLNRFTIPITCIVLSVLLTKPSLLFSQNKPPDQIGVVLAGGGALGLAHVGVLQVLEELEIPIDRIAGTSMGGLVGGLYVIGYTPDQLEKIAMDMDWEVMIGNDIDREKSPFAARIEQERFIFSVTRKGTQVGLESALVDGTNIYQKIQELCAPAFEVRDFEKLPTPFFCVAADLEFEDQVVFHRGYLPDVLRASMSIPLVFNPVKMDDMLLVDGGLFNNFPVREMRAKGVDLVIGVRLIEVDSTNGSTGLFDMIGKTYEVVMNKVRCEYEDECDVCIDVLLPGLGASDFDRAGDLIRLGREAAEKMADELKGYSSKNYKKKENLIVTDQQLVLDEISISGEQYIKEEKIRKILQLPLGRSIHFSDIQEAMEKLQATNLFESMRYRVEKKNGNRILQLFLEEKSSDFFKIGLRYDNDFGASLLLNSTFRHTFTGGDYALIEFRLTRNPYFKTAYIFRSLREYTPFFSAILKGDDYHRFTSENDYDIFQHNQLEVKSGLQWTPFNSLQIKTGIEWQWYGFNENADQNVLTPLNKHLLNYFADISIDRLDNSAFPTKGYKAYLNSKFVTPSVSNFGEADKNIWLSGGFFKMFRYSEKITGKLSCDVGLTTGFIDQQFLFYQGGMYNHLRSNFTLQPGLSVMRYNDRNMASLGYGMRVEVFNGHHFLAGYHISSLSPRASDVLEGKWQQGFYAGYSLKTIIGPLKIQAGFPTEDFDIDIFISAGHNF